MEWNKLIEQPESDWLYYNPEDLTDIHVFANSSQTSDRGKTVSEIDVQNKGKHRQIIFCYNILDSSEYYVQKILNDKSFGEIYTDYSYSDNSGLKDGENENIVCPGIIYLLDQNEDIALRLKTEFSNLQKPIY